MHDRTHLMHDQIHLILDKVYLMHTNWAETKKYFKKQQGVELGSPALHPSIIPLGYRGSDEKREYFNLYISVLLLD